MSRGSNRLLVVEDHADSRELLAEFFESLGYEVEVAGNGWEALQRLRRGPRPAVLLLDLMMPVMSGWELMRHVSADPALSGLPVVVISGAGTSQPPPEGVYATVPKPVDLNALRTSVERATRGA